LMFSTFDLCLLLYVIRLAGWLKHCNLSLSLYVCVRLHAYEYPQSIARAVRLIGLR